MSLAVNYTTPAEGATGTFHMSQWCFMCYFLHLELYTVYI